jgi:hypothetical protein
VLSNDDGVAMPGATFVRSEAAFCAVLFAIGFLLCWLPLALLPSTIPVLDELYQFLEPGHRIAFGYGMVPWEFDYGARSWALGYAAALPMALAGLLGQGPSVYLPLTWGLFALGEGAMILCAGLWGARLYGRLGGLAVAVVAASWIDNLHFGGRALSEIVTGHLLVIAVWLAEPGYEVRDRRRLALSGFLATLAVLLRLQLAPAVAVLWLWRWRDRRRLLLLGAGAAVAVVLDGAFDTLTWGTPFLPLWQNFKYNALLDGAASFGTEEAWWYFEHVWARWGVLALPFLGLAGVGAQRLPLLAWMALVIVVVHMAVAHKEYRFIQPAVMMASILCGLGLVEATGRLNAVLRTRWGRTRSLAAAVMALFWLCICGFNLQALGEAPWQTNSSLLETTGALSRLHPLCGVGFVNMSTWDGGAYTFLHQRVPTFYSIGTQAHMEAFFNSQQKFDVLVLKRQEMDLATTLDDYKLVQCYQDHCVLKREGGCSGGPEPRPPVTAMSIAATHDARYPYPVGVP